MSGLKFFCDIQKSLVCSSGADQLKSDGQAICGGTARHGNRRMAANIDPCGEHGVASRAGFPAVDEGWVGFSGGPGWRRCGRRHDEIGSVECLRHASPKIKNDFEKLRI